MTKSHTHQGLGIAALLVLMALLTVAPQAHANYVYDLQFGALTYNSITYPADGFSFTLPALIGSGGVIPTLLDPSLELNGFTFNHIDDTEYTSLGVYHLAFSHIADFSVHVGDVGAFAIYLESNGPFGPGVYTSNHFGRGIKTSQYEIENIYTTGSLSIREVAVPGPATILLLGTGLLGLGAWRRFRKD